MIIDPNLFNSFDIKHVPSFVVAKQETCLGVISCKPQFDKISGNVSVQYALEQIQKNGEVQ